MLLICCLLCLPGLGQSSNAQLNAQTDAPSFTVQGRILDYDGEGLPFAHIYLAGSEIGTVADDAGYFELDGIHESVVELQVSAVGYRTLRESVTLPVENQMHFELKEDRIGLDAVVISATTDERFVSSAPVPVEVLSGEYLQNRIAPTQLVEAVSLISGVQEVVSCGVCFTNNISINGLPGAYTAVLIDGAPIYGNLASVYGLNGIPASIVDRYEVIKGPASTLYGSEAVGGVLNIITKKPQHQDLIQLDTRYTSHGEVYADWGHSFKVSNWNSWIGGQYAYQPMYEDENGDGFGDGVQLDRVSLFNKWSMNRASGKAFNWSAKIFYEDRRNGVEDFLRDRAYRRLRGNDSIYGESIYTKRAELISLYEFDSRQKLSLQFSASAHQQNSFYGSDFYEAEQYLSQLDLRWREKIGNHRLRAGMALRYNYYDDNTVATEGFSDGVTGDNGAQIQWIPGIYAEDEWEFSKDWTLLSGLRLDQYQAHGIIPSPRLALKWQSTPKSSLGARFGTGFRIINLFTEDHAFITGQREVLITEDLRPEKSWNVSARWSQQYGLDKHEGVFDLDFYYTQFSQSIFPNYDEPGQIIYSNSDDQAYTRGFNLSWTHAMSFPMTFTLAGNAQQSRRKIGEEYEDLEFAPAWTQTSSISYDWKQQKLFFAYSYNIIGPMTLPEVFELNEQGDPLEQSRSTRSQAFGIHTMQVTRNFPKQGLQLYGGVQNLWDYRQAESPLVGYNDPNFEAGFSPFFDTAYAYSPSHGREFYIGLRWNYNK
jgi:outer membrane receptor for ferrienterochelin and colicins